jgi:anhydro-N-acetylmuramic acid kinase
MSGTSLDGVDGAMVEFSTSANSHLQLKTLASASRAMPRTLQSVLRRLAESDYRDQGNRAEPFFDPIEAAALAANALSDLYLEVIGDLRTQSPDTVIMAVGAHGQTIRHRPEQGFTLQLINGARIAAHSNLPTLCDFRSTDIALGGQGAPLVPLFHQDALSVRQETRLILNLGGIANLSILSSGQVTGFDTGPASTLLDAWAQKHLGTPYDDCGAWAASGRSDDGLLKLLLSEAFFSLPAPKSTGRELFSLPWLEAKLQLYAPSRSLSAADIQATLSRLTAQSIADAANNALDRKNEASTTAASTNRITTDRTATSRTATNANQDTSAPKVAIYACGGGVRNLRLMEDIEMALQRVLNPALKLQSTNELGIDAQQMEACAFAWLAWKRWNLQPLNYSPVTGSRRPHLAGALYLP